MKHLKVIFLVAAIMMPLSIVGMDKDGENGNDAGKPYLLREVSGINSDMRAQVVENDFDLNGIPRHVVPKTRDTASTPWVILYMRIHGWPEDIRLEVIKHFAQKDSLYEVTIDDAIKTADLYVKAVEERRWELYPFDADEKPIQDAEELSVRDLDLDALPNITKILEELKLERLKKEEQQSNSNNQ